MSGIWNPSYLISIATVTRTCGRACYLSPALIHACPVDACLPRHSSSVAHIFAPHSSFFCPPSSQPDFKASHLGQMGLSFSKQKSNLSYRAALNNAHRAGDAQTYREIEQSIHREKQGLATSRSYPALPPAHQPHASALHTPYGQASTINSSTNSNNMIPNNHTYPQPSHHGYGGGYAAINGQRSQPVPGRSFLSWVSDDFFAMDRSAADLICTTPRWSRLPT